MKDTNYEYSSRTKFCLKSVLRVKSYTILNVTKDFIFRRIEKNKHFNLKAINMISRKSQDFCKVEASGTKEKRFTKVQKSF